MPEITLPAVAESLDDVPEAFREAYEPTQDGKFQIAIEGADEAFAGPVSRALERVKSERNKYRTSYRAAEDIIRLVESHGLTMSDIESLISEGDDADVTPEDPPRSSKKTKTDRLFEETRSERDTYRNLYLTEVRTNVAQAALSKHGGEPALLLGPLLERISVDVNGSGKASVKLALLDGDEDLFDFPESIDELVVGMKKHPIFGRGFDDRKKDAASAESAETDGESVRISRDEARDPERYRWAKAQAEKLGLPLELTD